jgi:hypothetical protein
MQRTAAAAAAATTIYDSKAHDAWLLKKASWYETNVPPSVPKGTQLSDLLAEQATCQAGYDELKDDIDEEEHQPVTDKVLKGLEKQHNELTLQKEELEQTKKQVYKQLQQLKVLLTPQVKDQIQAYQQTTAAVLETFNITDHTEASPILSQLQQLYQQQTQTEKELARVAATLDELIKIKFNPKCDACTINPYKHKREALEKEQQDLQLDIKKTQSAISKVLPPNTTYDQLKKIYDSWQTLHTTKIITAIDNQTRCNQGLEEHKQLTQQIADLAEEIDDVGWESQTNVNEFYYNKKRLEELAHIVAHLKFTEEEKEVQAAKASHILDLQIQKLEKAAAQAYYHELSQTETRVKAIEQQILDHDQYNLTKQRISQVNRIIEAYPHFTNAQTIESKLKPLIQAAATTEATLNQNQALSSQMAEAKTFEQQIGTFRHLLEQRSQLISKLSDAYSKYTSWLYPTKVGPAIETAVNDVLNSIQFPRPICLNGEWDKDHFIWYVRDGNSRPPYEK